MDIRDPQFSQRPSEQECGKLNLLRLNNLNLINCHVGTVNNKNKHIIDSGFV